MTQAGFRIFDETVQKSVELLKDIEEELGWSRDRRVQSYSALRAVLQTLRDRMTVEQSARFSAQLPMLLRGMFYDGFTPARMPRKMSRAEFLNEVRQKFGYSVDMEFESFVRSVFGALRKHVSEGEIEDVLSDLPQDIVRLLAA